jgi:hypothetical protein
VVTMKGGRLHHAGHRTPRSSPYSPGFLNDSVRPGGTLHLLRWYRGACREHILPAALSGTAVLPKASCRSCGQSAISCRGSHRGGVRPRRCASRRSDARVPSGMNALGAACPRRGLVLFSAAEQHELDAVPYEAGIDIRFDRGHRAGNAKSEALGVPARGACRPPHRRARPAPDSDPRAHPPIADRAPRTRSADRAIPATMKLGHTHHQG